jgi:hypothetical protein
MFVAAGQQPILPAFAVEATNPDQAADGGLNFAGIVAGFLADPDQSIEV